ncbi:MAG: alkaline phosphatase family protein [Balneolales bacterium]|nr:alkaline phosphatase family protein [Balneolales bacterium]
MGVLFLFIDGIGLGEASRDNPFSEHEFPGFSRLTGGELLTRDAKGSQVDDVLFKSIDACLGVDGLPQSGTGQAALFSGENASAMIGKHFGPFPHSGIKPLLQEQSLFHQAQSAGLQPYFMNAFPKIFFDRATKLNRWSCATLMTRSAGVRLNSLDEVRNGEAITAEILQDYWQTMLKLDIPAITFEDAASRVMHALDRYDVVLMEYYLTDKAGHARDMQDAVRALERVDGFITAFLDENQRSGQKHTLVISSDHGNVEDLSIKSHTVNNVPLLVAGPKAGKFADIQDLTGVTPAILSCF